MSFRQEGKKEKDRAKMSVRDMRLFLALSGQKKVEEQETMLGEIDGVRRKTPTKRSSSTVKRSSGRTDIFHTEEVERDLRVKKRLKKMSKKKCNLECGLWKEFGPDRNTFKGESWTKYSPYIGKINEYEGFDTSEAPPLNRLYPNQEHRDRFVLCHVCEKTMNSTENMAQCQTGVCMHKSCLIN